MKQRLIPVAIIVVILIAAAFLLIPRKDMAPELQFKTLDQKSLSLTELRGKVVLVNFWATSCSGCMAEMPDLVKIQQQYGQQGYQTVAIAMQYDQRNYIDTYQQKMQLPFLISHDTENTAATAFGGVNLTPTTFLIGKDGAILQKYVGTPDMNELKAKIEAALRT
ncbi:peroxiredoxin family protein [Chitinilyticum piscinae]|uniref:TlpA family protein disulfide reductase n=1 Tax=Chitinilyticum piscinae TaxID=2866724 RepID=A0A8J7FL35_9NEIS|nr:TlpA disulfide reductase family protein [Chitinilyticum piscinae]MBE9608191.1 TlpA family protein disulfide reductase [Chitinilyticum piscinae]